MKKSPTLIILFCAAMAMPGFASASEAAGGGSAMNAWRSSTDQAVEYSKAGKLDQALAAAELALDTATKGFGSEDERVAQSLRTIAQVHLARQNVFQSEIYFGRSLELYKKVKGLNDPETANTMVLAGSLYLNLQRFPEAEELLRTGYEVLRNTYGKDDMRITAAMGGLAETYKSIGDERSVELFRGIIRILSASRGGNDPGVISSYYHLADIYEALKDYDNAADCYFTIIRTLEEQHGIHYWQLSSIYNNLGLVYARAGRLSEAENAYRHSVDILVRKFGPGHPEVTTVLENLNSIYVQRSNNEGKAS